MSEQQPLLPNAVGINVEHVASSVRSSQPSLLSEQHHDNAHGVSFLEPGGTLAGVYTLSGELDRLQLFWAQ